MQGLGENHSTSQINPNDIYSRNSNANVVVVGTGMSSAPSTFVPGTQELPPSQIQQHKQSYPVGQNFGHHQQFQAINGSTERRRRIPKPLAKLSYKEPTYVAISDGFVPTWNQLLPSSSEIWRQAEQARKLKAFKLSILNVSEFTIAGLVTGYNTPPTSVRGLRSHIKNISRSHGKAVWEQGSQGAEGKWRIPLGAYHAFHAFLTSDPMTTVEGIPPNQLKIASIGRARLAKDSPSVEKLVSRGVPHGLASALASFQREGVEFVAEKEGRALIADEMGLGKTVQAIASMAVFAAEWPLLVLSPSAARYHWENEFNQWLGFSSSVNNPPEETAKKAQTNSQPQGKQKTRALLHKSQIHVLGSAKDKILPNASVRIVICSYGLAPRLVTQGKIIAGQFKCVIVDESHMLKNRATKRTSALLPILNAANRVVLLSGTPAFARPMELWPQLTVLRTERHGWWHDETSFFDEYVKHGSSSKRAELHTLLTGTVMIRRMKVDILKSLPAKARERMLMEVSDASLKKEFQTCLLMLRSGKGALGRIARKRAIANGEQDHQPTPVPVPEDAPSRKSVLNHLYCLTGRSKIQTIIKMLKLFLKDKTKGKLCIFAHHIFVLDALVAEGELSNAEGSPTRYIRIDGSTLPRQRQDQIDTFQNDPSVRVAVLGITAAGVAVTLTAASTVWFAELFWTPALMIQAEDRCHRIGQQAKVTCLYVVAKGTLDEILWDLMEKKFRALGEFVEGKEKMKLVVNRTYNSESDWFGEFNNSNDDEDADADADADPPTDPVSMFDFDEVGEGIEHDIEELARTEQLMVRTQESDDEGDGDAKPRANNSMKQMSEASSRVPGDGLGRTEDEAICLEDHDDDGAAGEAKVANPVVSIAGLKNKPKRRIRPPSHLPRLRLYKMQFRGPTYGFRIKVYKGRMIVMGISADRLYQLGNSAKPNVGDIIVAINGLPLPLASSRKQLLVLLERASKNPPIDILFGEDVEFAEHFNTALLGAESSVPAIGGLDQR